MLRPGKNGFSQNVKPYKAAGREQSAYYLHELGAASAGLIFYCENQAVCYALLN